MEARFAAFVRSLVSVVFFAIALATTGQVSGQQQQVWYLRDETRGVQVAGPFASQGACNRYFQSIEDYDPGNGAPVGHLADRLDCVVAPAPYSGASTPATDVWYYYTWHSGNYAPVGPFASVDACTSDEHRQNTPVYGCESYHPNAPPTVTWYFYRSCYGDDYCPSGPYPNEEACNDALRQSGDPGGGAIYLCYSYRPNVPPRLITPAPTPSPTPSPSPVYRRLYAAPVRTAAPRVYHVIASPVQIPQQELTCDYTPPLVLTGSDGISYPANASDSGLNCHYAYVPAVSSNSDDASQRVSRIVARLLSGANTYAPTLQPDGKTWVTKCNIFVSDVAKLYLGPPDAALVDAQGHAKHVSDQIAAMADSSSRWSPIEASSSVCAHTSSAKCLEERFANAQAEANAGHLVVVAWKNPQPTDTDTGHIAVVVPGELVPSGVWGMMVPEIAQAGPPGEIFTLKGLGFGFNPKTQNHQSMWTTLLIYERQP